jgi:eukaryotic-like serine/threonine-protein kinase
VENLRLVRQVGRGAMGSVWVADHLGLQSQVAVKFMLSASLNDPVSVARFRQEAKAAAEIRSPHVVQVFDHGVTEEGENFIVMELLKGESLGERVKRVGASPLHRVVSLATQACKALAKAHTRGISHRDIKPDNIFLSDSAGEVYVKVLDFGVAKFSGQEAINMTAVGNMVGTPAFMSPEQLFDGFELDHRGDLWSLAVVIYFALTAQRPFTGATLGELCVSVKLGEYTPVTTIRHDLPREIDAFFEQALHRDIGSRFQTAKELALALESVAGVASTMSSTPSSVAVSMPLPGDQASQLRSASKLARQRRRKGALAGGVVVAVAVATLIFLLGPGQAADKGSLANPTDTDPAAAVDPAADDAGKPTSAAAADSEDGDDKPEANTGKSVASTTPKSATPPASSASAARPKPKRPARRNVKPVPVATTAGPTKNAMPPGPDPKPDETKQAPAPRMGKGSDSRTERAKKMLGL